MFGGELGAFLLLPCESCFLALGGHPFLFVTLFDGLDLLGTGVAIVCGLEFRLMGGVAFLVRARGVDFLCVTGLELLRFLGVTGGQGFVFRGGPAVLGQVALLSCLLGLFSLNVIVCK